MVGDFFIGSGDRTEESLVFAVFVASSIRFTSNLNGRRSIATFILVLNVGLLVTRR